MEIVFPTHHFSWLAIWIGVAFAGPAMAEGSGGGHPIAIESFFQPPAIRAIKLSPSGKQLAFTTGKGREHVGLAVMDLDGELRVHWVAGFSDADVDRFEWVNDERLVYTATDLNEGSADEGSLRVN